MSKIGIQKFAQVLSLMQETRLELLSNPSNALEGSQSHQQDILLGQLLDTAKETVQHLFCQITMMGVESDVQHTCLTCGRKTCDRQPEDNDPVDCKDWKTNKK